MRNTVELAKKGHGEEQSPGSRGIYSDTGAGYQMLVVEVANLPDVAATEGAQTATQTVAEPMESGRIPSWLARTWRHAGEKGEFDVDLKDWLGEYPDLVRLIEACNGSTIDAWPRADLPQTYTIRLKPRALETLQAQTQRKHQPKKKRLDARNAKIALIKDGDIRGLAVDARCWLRNLGDIQRSKANASERMLQSLIGLRYVDLERAYPDLLANIETALTGPNKEKPVCV